MSSVGGKTQYLMDWIVRAKPRSQVLDCGCGDGTHAMYLARNGMVVSALDLILRPRHLSDEIAYFQSDMLNWCPSEKFDVVTLLGVLHYGGTGERWRAMLSRCFGWLKTDGILALTWITDRIKTAHAPSGWDFPSVTDVHEFMRCASFAPIHQEIIIREHAHSNLPPHSHEIAYELWGRLQE